MIGYSNYFYVMFYIAKTQFIKVVTHLKMDQNNYN